ncbi:MAG: sigma 54-interacting transcriptional regulator [Bacillota bacterium]|nr:sigma 54-interacting transcriptional regulator [Bacillota bacterium]
MSEKYLEQCIFAGSLLDLVEAAIYFCDLDGRFVHINKTAEKLDGYSLEQLRGKTVLEAYNLDDTPLLRSLHSEQPIEDITFRYNVNGVNVLQICNARPLFINGKKVGAYTIQRDVTKLKGVIEDNINLQQRLFPNATNHSADREGEKQGFRRLIGQHPSFLEALSTAAVAAQNDSPVMITGSTGCGKELFAQCIHQAGKRYGKPFLAINCAAIPQQLLESILFGTAKGAYTGAVEKPGLFEQAEGGTLFLDEINSMPKYSQSKLLRVLEEYKVRHLGSNEDIPINVRIISSSNGLSNNREEQGQIREDLFYRLAVLNIVIPDLSARKSDIPLLVDYYIKHYNKVFNKNVQGLDWEVNRFFYEYHWPGNVRQLKNCLESAMNFVDNGHLIKKKHLPQYLFGGVFSGFIEHKQDIEETDKPQKVTPSKQEPVEPENVFDHIRTREREKIIEALILNNGNISKTAAYLKVPRQSLVYRLKKYGIK